MIRRFTSPSAFRAECLARGLRPSTTDWWNVAGASIGRESFDETMAKALTGDRSLVPQAEALVRRLDSTIAVPRRTWHANVAGPICIVPDILAGRPTPFRRLTEVADEHQPISIYVRPNANASVNAAMLQKRGIAILALVMALARARPISLHYFFVGEGFKTLRDGCREVVFDVRIETAPLDLARACYILSSAAYYRRLGFGLTYALGGVIGELISLRRSEDICHKLLGNDPRRTLVIGPADIRDPLLTSPVEWINAQVRRFIKETEDA